MRKLGAKYFAAVAATRRAISIPDFTVCAATVKIQYYYFFFNWHQEYLHLETHMKENKPHFWVTVSHVILSSSAALNYNFIISSL